MRARRRRKKLTIASRMIAPRNETTSEPTLKSPRLMVPVWKSGASSRPPRNAPTMPTTTLRMMPCWSLVFMTMLASQPRTPPTMSHMMKVINTPNLVPANGGLPSARASGCSQLVCRCRCPTARVVVPLLELGVLGPDAARLVDRVLGGVLLELRRDGGREVDAGDVGELDEVDRHVGDLFRYALPLFGHLAARLVGREPLEELEELGRLDADRGGEALRVVELLPVALIAKLEHLGDRLLHHNS